VAESRLEEVDSEYGGSSDAQKKTRKTSELTKNRMYTLIEDEDESVIVENLDSSSSGAYE